MTMDNHTPDLEPRTRIRIPYPKGLMRLAFRAPILLYRMKLGFLLGKRFVLVEHRGRRSGLLRRTVVEVVDYNPTDRSVVVVAAWGEKADWYRNICVDPHVAITVGAKRYAAIAKTIPKDEAEPHLRAYAEHHPMAFRELDRLIEGPGKRTTEEIIQAFLETMPTVEFHPTDKAPSFSAN
jgi:deazaflavin-dependent oxidoreductase (nitroreductase family)